MFVVVEIQAIDSSQAKSRGMEIGVKFLADIHKKGEMAKMVSFSTLLQNILNPIEFYMLYSVSTYDSKCLKVI